MSERKKEVIIWIAAAVFSLIACGLCVYFAETVGKFSESYSPDEERYIAMAKRLINHKVYGFWNRTPDAYVSPGYPLFLVVCIKIFGGDLAGIHCIKLVQCVLSGMTAFFTFLFGRKITGNSVVGLIATALTAFIGYYAQYARRMLTENFYFFMMMLFFVVFVYINDSDKWWKHAIAGAVFCIAVMVRPLIIIIAPFLYLPKLVKFKKEFKKWLFPLLGFAGGFVVVALPWWIRNIVVLHQFVLLATQTNPLFFGLAPDVKQLGVKDPGTFTGNLALLFKLLITKPATTLYWFTFGKFSIIFLEDQKVSRLQNLTAIVKDFTLYVGLLGCVRALFTKKYRWASVVFIVYLLSSFLFIPVARYAVQYFPLLAVFTGWVVTDLFTFKDKTPKLETGSEQDF